MRSPLLLLFVVLNFNAFAVDRERPLKPGPGHSRGNEHSARIQALNTGQPVFGGNACPPGTMQVVFAPDFLSFTIIFDQFVAQVADGTKNHDSMSCDAQIPIQIPAGMQMEITRVDLRGFLGLPDRSRATLHSAFNFRGKGGDRDRINLRYQFQGPVMDNYLISTDAMNGDGSQTPVSEVSPCGEDAVLRVQTDIRLMSPGKGATASITLDSVDSSGHAVYYVNWRTCTGVEQNVKSRGRDPSRF